MSKVQKVNTSYNNNFEIYQGYLFWVDRKLRHWFLFMKT